MKILRQAKINDQITMGAQNFLSGIRPHFDEKNGRAWFQQGTKVIGNIFQNDNFKQGFTQVIVQVI